MERWVCIETADRKQSAWCEHGEYRRYVFGPVNVKRKRARLDLTSHQTYRSTKRIFSRKSEIARHFSN